MNYLPGGPELENFHDEHASWHMVMCVWAIPAGVAVLWRKHRRPPSLKLAVLRWQHHSCAGQRQRRRGELLRHTLAVHVLSGSLPLRAWRQTFLCTAPFLDSQESGVYANATRSSHAALASRAQYLMGHMIPSIPRWPKAVQLPTPVNTSHVPVWLAIKKALHVWPWPESALMRGSPHAS